MDLSVRAIFETSRTWYKFSDKEVSDEILKKIYDLTKMGPTSANCQPLRIVFVKSKEAKAKLIPMLMDGNKAKSESASVVALFAYDEKFYKNMPELFPHAPSMSSMFESNKDLSYTTALRNSSLQAAYFIVAAKSLGVDCGPMSGFNADAINAEFFSNTDHKVNFICNLGYRADDENYPRLKRLDFDDTCEVI
jgi:3-hydroxypropanoate dehydrogenase